MNHDDSAQGTAEQEATPQEITRAAQFAEETRKATVLFHDPDDLGYAVCPLGERTSANYAITSTAFERWLVSRYLDLYKVVPSEAEVRRVVRLCDALALHQGPRKQVHLRIAETPRAIYLDLCDKRWRAVKIEATGWRVVTLPRVHFRRAQGMLPLPVPRRGGDLTDLRRLLNFTQPHEWTLAMSWEFATVQNHASFPVLCLHGEPGSGKTTAGLMLRNLVDPNTAQLAAPPTTTRDVMIRAHNAWIVGWDNLSEISVKLSDTICRLATGAGFAKRRLYTDTDETVFTYRRPVLLTSITDVATRGDLLDRAIMLHLATIPKEQRRSESELLDQYRTLRPALLGAMLTVIAGALRDLPDIRLDELPRMADYFRWVIAAARSMGWTREAVTDAETKNRAEINAMALEASILTSPLVTLLEQAERGAYKGQTRGLRTDNQGVLFCPATLLRDTLRKMVDEADRSHKVLKSLRAMHDEIVRIQGNLRKIGVIVERNRTSKERGYRIRRGRSA
ncbi:MAG TPA: hypothetical protein VKZ50_04545 [bacterium]|nr:hypothetical protein [bacterium]